jgi:hypothetical protein
MLEDLLDFKSNPGGKRSLRRVSRALVVDVFISKSICNAQMLSKQLRKVNSQIPHQLNLFREIGEQTVWSLSGGGDWAVLGEGYMV